MFQFVAQAVGYGFAAGTSPGPLQSFIVSTTLSQGWRRGLIIIVSPLITDAPIILVMTFVLHQLPHGVLRAIQIGGGLFVLWLALDLARALRAGAVVGGQTIPQTDRRTLSKAVVINLLSPGPYIFWGSVTGPLLVEALDQSVVHGVSFLAAFYATFLSIMALWVLAFDRLRRLDARLTRAVLGLSIGVLVILGLALFSQGVRR